MDQQIEQPRTSIRPGRATYRLRPFLAAFRYAFYGIQHLFTTQRNAQIHGVSALCVIILGGLLNLARWEWLVLIITITMVLAAEGFNTAIEATVDLASSARHPLAKTAKDVAAGTVLICAIGAVCVGCTIFIPHLWPLIQGWFPPA
jgi:diacylglycerol kinase